MKCAASRWLIAVAAAFPLLCAYSCAVPLGPGYAIEKESVELNFLDQPQPQLHLHGFYRLENTGKGPLTSLDVTVPNKDLVGRENLRITVDGAEVHASEIPSDTGTMSVAHISFEPAWLPHQKKSVEIACDIVAGSDNERAAMGAATFAADGAYWFPAFQTPKGLFAKGERRAALTDLSIVLPKDFLVVAPGLSTGRKSRGDTTEYRYRLRATDLTPFVVAGRYKQQTAKGGKTSIYFWTFQGLPEDAITSAAEQIASAARFFDSTFVARGRGEVPIRLVEIPESSAPNHSVGSVGETGSFPSIILLSKDALAQDIGHGQVSPLEIGALADTWLQWMASPRDAESILEDSLRSYFVDAFYESRDGAAYRQKKIAEYLRRYDRIGARAVEKPVAQITFTASDSSDQINMALAKASLFPYALEDACDQAALRRGIGVMLSDLRGEEYGYADLRAALGNECGPNVNLDALFRSWLFEGGVPADFRARYPGGTNEQNAK